MADQLTHADIARRVKQAIPSLANVPDALIVARVLASRPDLQKFLQQPAVPWAKGIEAQRSSALGELVNRFMTQPFLKANQSMVAAHPALGVWERMMTPGVASVTPSPHDDPFYVRKIQELIQQFKDTPYRSQVVPDGQKAKPRIEED